MTIETPRFHKTASVDWADQVASAFEADWTDKPRVALYSDTASECDNYEQQLITWTDARYQVGDWWSSGYTITAPREGLYVLNLSLDWEANTDGIRDAQIGTFSGLIARDKATPEQTNGYCSQALSTVAYLREGEAFLCAALQDSGATLDVNASDSTNIYKQDFSAIWIGAL